MRSFITAMGSSDGARLAEPEAMHAEAPSQTIDSCCSRKAGARRCITPGDANVLRAWQGARTVRAICRAWGLAPCCADQRLQKAPAMRAWPVPTPRATLRRSWRAWARRRPWPPAGPWPPRFWRRSRAPPLPARRHPQTPAPPVRTGMQRVLTRLWVAARLLV